MVPARTMESLVPRHTPRRVPREIIQLSFSVSPYVSVEHHQHVRKPMRASERSASTPEGWCWKRRPCAPSTSNGLAEQAMGCAIRDVFAFLYKTRKSVRPRDLSSCFFVTGYN